MINKPEDMAVIETEKPVLEDGEALIKVHYVGICGTDLHLLHGHHATATYPLIPGHEFVGELADIKGKDAESFKIGGKVSAQMVLACGRCTACAKGEDNV